MRFGGYEVKFIIFAKKTVDLQLLKHTSPFGQLLALLLIILGLGIFTSLLGILIGAAFIDGDILLRLQTISEMKHTDDLWLMKATQIFSQLGFFVFPALLFGFLVDKNLLVFFKLQNIPQLSLTLLGIIIIAAAIPFSDWLIYNNNLIELPESLSHIESWMREAEKNAANMTNLFLEMDSWTDYIINILMIGVLAAIGEELILRGILQPIFIKLSKHAHLGILITAFVFSFIHFQFYGFFARFFMGVILGYLYYYSHNLWIPIIVHFFNNAAAVSYVYFTNTPLYAVNLNDTGVESPSGLYAFISVLVVVLGVYVLRWRANFRGVSPKAKALG